MPFEEMKIKGAWVHTPSVFPDERGSFHEVFKLSAIEEQLGRSFKVKQVNQSTSAKGVIRGIHFTDSVEGQAKYVSCPKGKIWDVVVDLRKDSPTYGQWIAEELTADNGRQILVPKGFLHGFLTLLPDTEVQYKCTDLYAPAHDGGVRWDSCGIDWGLSSTPILSAKDESAPAFADWQSPFVWEGAA